MFDKINKILPFFVILLLARATAQQIPPSTIKPNIIFVLTDDQRFDALGAAGNTIIKTPNLDQLAARGLLYQNAYVTTSICCVSRASILTGQYESRHKINDFGTDFSPSALQNTYPPLLKKAGYKIGFVGKYGVGENPPAEEFDYWSCNKKGQPPYIYKDAQGRPVHHTDSVSHDIEIFLNKFAGKGPFCLSVGFKAPHELDGKPPKYVTQARFDDLYKDVTIPIPETADPKYWNSFPDFFRTDNNVARDRWNWFFSTPEKYQESVKDYYRLVTGVDEAVGKMIAQLKKLGIDKNTVVIFMGDNGFYLGEHGLEGKWYGHEESIRVPLIVYDPRGQNNGRKVEDMVLNIDIAPTILSLAGASVPDRMQGKALQALSGKKQLPRKDFFYEHTFNKSPKIPQVEGVVGRAFKYMKFIEHGYEELYNTKTDPKETKNLAADKRYLAKLEEMRKLYIVKKEEVK